MFAASGVLYALGGITFGTIEEGQGAEERSRSGWADLRSRIVSIISVAGFRRFVVVEALLVPLTQGLVLFTLLGKRELGLEVRDLGLLVVVDAVCPVVGNFAWGWLADVRGNRILLAASAVSGLAAPACAASLLTHPGADVVVPVFAAVVIFISLASTGVHLATKNYVLELAPDDQQRPLYIGVMTRWSGFPRCSWWRRASRWTR